MKPRVFQSDAQGKEVKSEKKLQGTFWPQKVELARNFRKKKDKTHLCVNQNDAKRQLHKNSSFQNGAKIE